MNPAVADVLGGVFALALISCAAAMLIARNFFGPVDIAEELGLRDDDEDDGVAS